MNKKYKDRGIIKWAPFDGLAGFNNLYMELKKTLEKLEKTELDGSKLEEFDIVIKKALQNNLDVQIVYHFNGKNYKTNSKIKKVNIDEKKLVLEPIKVLYIKDVLEIKIL